MRVSDWETDSGDDDDDDDGDDDEDDDDIEDDDGDDDDAGALLSMEGNELLGRPVWLRAPPYADWRSVFCISVFVGFIFALLFWLTCIAIIRFGCFWRRWT